MTRFASIRVLPFILLLPLASPAWSAESPEYPSNLNGERIPPPSVYTARVLSGEGSVVVTKELLRDGLRERVIIERRSGRGVLLWRDSLENTGQVRRETYTYEGLIAIEELFDRDKVILDTRYRYDEKRRVKSDTTYRGDGREETNRYFYKDDGSPLVILHDNGSSIYLPSGMRLEQRGDKLYKKIYENGVETSKETFEGTEIVETATYRYRADGSPEETVTYDERLKRRVIENYDPQGYLTARTLEQNDIFTDRRSYFYANKKLSKEIIFHPDGRQDRKEYGYNDQGIRVSEIYYKDGALFATAAIAGELRVEKYYRDGAFIWRRTYRDGSLVEEGEDDSYAR